MIAMSTSTNIRPTPFKKRVLIPFWLAQFAFMIFLFSFRRLKPTTYLIFQAAQMLIWQSMFLKEVVISINEEDSHVGCPNITLAAIPFVAVISALLYVHNPGTSTILDYADLPLHSFTFIGSLIYASVLLRRHRRSKKRLLQSNILIRPLT